MSLALVIPVHNDQASLERLLAQAARLDLFDEVIVVDDGSDEPVVLPTERPAGAQLLRHDRPQGAGAARNRGLSHVTASHFVFFDADDLFTAEFPRLWADLANTDFDFCIYRHHDDSARHFGGTAQLPHDELRWALAGANTQTLAKLSGPALWRLAETGNYPWNKIYQTAFAKANGLRCTETLVHNDIELHWHSFLAAKTVLSSNRICAEHFVHGAQKRLTQDTSAKRLQLFEALQIVNHLIKNHSNEAAELAFLRFSSSILEWVRDMLHPSLWPSLDIKTESFLRAALSETAVASLIAHDQALALRLLLMLANSQTRQEAVA